jgi:DNA-binding response OmpR family regulator
MNRILITDDEPHVLRVLKLSLERHGYEVDQALNGEVALKKIKQQRPDVLITDIHMPQLSGEALCKQLQDEIPHREFLIFVLTSRTEVEHREWSSKIDNLQFLEKPVSIRKLIIKLNEYFAAKSI